VTSCGRCGANVTDYVWFCWLCEAPLCSDCGDGVGHCHYNDAALDEIDRECATADETRRGALLEVMRQLAARYGSRVPLLVRRTLLADGRRLSVVGSIAGRHSAQRPPK
jgi:hypothetical protein